MTYGIPCCSDYATFESHSNTAHRSHVMPMWVRDFWHSFPGPVVCCPSKASSFALFHFLDVCMHPRTYTHGKYASRPVGVLPPYIIHVNRAPSVQLASHHHTLLVAVAALLDVCIQARRRTQAERGTVSVTWCACAACASL